ncbi:hypothetical protein BO82DRAFT_324311 [Aspergillus uvarum CBS 121591]|uniref:Uncharacterized protein n=1 Tax=Aspergillus uvarum CBS 121591 TaxID=1448315 RepID=A0A319CP50_9EURO|nr:hypothetical protein BO82DRAFT_324311 [Aspergillus uvarum CBS 121591]PYH86994.1 hypothetical protein BO82DRAFT_324311 [Aspergillus uvarum CBS 121591]
MPSFKHQHQQQKHHSFHPPPLFWDKLSKLWLTKSALREANRRNRSLFLYQGSSSIPHTFAPDFLRNCSTARLKEVRRFSRCGGPDLSDIRDYPAPAHFDQYSMDPDDPSPKRTTTKGSTAYDPHFEGHLNDHGIFMPSGTYPDGTKPPRPANIAEIQRRLRNSRPSMALSENSLEREYENFTTVNDKTSDEQLVVKKILPFLEGSQQYSFEDGGNHSFTNLTPLTDGTLANATPDFYHGARPNQLDNDIREDLSNTIIPTRRTNRPIAPNFFLETKGHDGSSAVLKRQACYDAALGARAMHALQQYGHGQSSNKPNYYDNNAYTIAATFKDGLLGLYVTHPTRSTDNNDPDTNYVMTQAGQWALHGDPDTYQRGITAYRNAQDLAREFRDDLIRQANEQYAAGQDNASGSDGSEETIKL